MIGNERKVKSTKFVSEHVLDFRDARRERIRARLEKKEPLQEMRFGHIPIIDRTTAFGEVLEVHGQKPEERAQVTYMPTTSGKKRVSPFFQKVKLSFAPLNLLAMFLVLALNLSAIFVVGPTLSYYSDPEEASANTFVAGIVDFTLTATPFATATGTATTSEEIWNVDVVPHATSNPFYYYASSTNFHGSIPLCNVITVIATLDGEVMFDGLLTELFTATTTNVSEWEFEFDNFIGDFPGETCHFDIDFNGWQTRHDLVEGGYSDTETVSFWIMDPSMLISKVYFGEDKKPPHEPNMCPAEPKGYWGNNEGCANGTGTSPYAADVQLVSNTFEGVFSGITSSEVCSTIVVNDCPNDTTVEGRRCHLKAHTLADELNIASEKLDPQAILSGSHDGHPAFATLGLSSTSTIAQALEEVEKVILDNAATVSELHDAEHVAERIYKFYSFENPDAPQCLYDTSTSTNGSYGGGHHGGGHGGYSGGNGGDWVELYNQTHVPIDISGWELCDDNSCDTLPDTPIVPGQGFVLIAESESVLDDLFVPDDVIVVIIPDGEIGDGLSGKRDMLRLVTDTEFTADQLNWGNPDPDWPNHTPDLWIPGLVPSNAPGALARVPVDHDTDEPDDWISLSAPSIKLKYPAPYTQTWFVDSTYNIKWAAVNPNGEDDDLQIDIYYENLDGERIPIALDTRNDGMHAWTVPQDCGARIKIVIVATAPENVLLNKTVKSKKIKIKCQSQSCPGWVNDWSSEWDEDDGDWSYDSAHGSTTVGGTTVNEFIDDLVENVQGTFGALFSTEEGVDEEGESSEEHDEMKESETKGEEEGAEVAEEESEENETENEAEESTVIIEDEEVIESGEEGEDSEETQEPDESEETTEDEQIDEEDF